MDKVLAVREFGHNRLVFKVFHQLFAKMQTGIINRSTLWKSYQQGKMASSSVKTSHMQRTLLVTYVSQRNTAIFMWSLPTTRWSLFHAHINNFSEVKRLFNSPSFLYYSTRSKPQEHFDSGLKGFADSVQADKHCDKVVNPWSLPEQKRSSFDDLANSSIPKEERIVSNPTEEARGPGLESSVKAVEANDAKDEDVPAKKPGIFKRFHHAYKQYGKVLVAVHICTSTVWTGLFYMVAMSGVNVEPALRWIGAGETIISFYTMPGVGHLAVTYLMYKLATPARYAVTIGGTHLAVKWLTHWGYMKPIPESDRLKSLVKDGKMKVKEKYDEYHDKMEDMRDELKELTSKEHKVK